VAHNVERNLVVVLLEPVELASALSGEGAAVIPKRRRAPAVRAGVILRP
jgi:hypothetical protein